jgi:hypothetical protein
MTTEQFAYWLQGFLELSENKTINERQVKIIKDHLALVFKKETPDRTEPKEHQKTDPRQLSFDFSKPEEKYLDPPRPVLPTNTTISC